MEPLTIQGATPDSDATAAPLASARARADTYRRSEASEAERSRRMSWLRLIVFLGVIGGLLVAERGSPGIVAPALIVSVLLGAVFVFLLIVHRRIRIRERHLGALAAVNEESVLRTERRWTALPDEPWGEIPPDYPEAEDLYLLGRASIFRLLGPPATVPGRHTLTRWLLDAAPPEEIRERQRAVQTLAPLVEFRDELSARGRTVPPGTQKEVDRFLAWVEGDRWLTGRTALRVAAVILPLLTAGLGWAYLAGALPAWWILPLLATVFVATRCTNQIHARFDAASAGESGVRRYDSLFSHLEDLPEAPPLLDGIRGAVAASDVHPSAHRAITSLRRILDTAETRRSMFGPLLQMGMLWDVHVLTALERWQERHGPAVRNWLGALGEAEALAALARLAHHHPDWCFPEIEPHGNGGPHGAPPVLEADAMGHPLLAPDRCVRNDVTVGPPGSVLLITGSNMSGKSTLLRALGANAALAGAGGPVCAARFRLPPLRLATCMRITDALDEGVSLFMAELNRLRQVVERARETPGTGRVLLYLLDEMLQGTNTAERQVAARRILGHLLDAGAIGAVTTHDLALADTPEMAERAVPVHFRETVEQGPNGTLLHFDYILRPGPATSRNALRLLEAVGLGDGGEADRVHLPD